MRKLLLSLAVTLVAATSALAASSDQEKAFVDAYKTAFEAKNTDGLTALMFTDGAIPMAVDFYTSMITADFGKKLGDVSLQDLDAEDTAKVGATMPTPDGGNAVLLPKPYKKLVITIDTSDDNGTSSSTSTMYVAEKDGKLGIAMPAPAP